ncbi:acyl-protein synthetase [Clostridium sp. SM-530-WT-3G]|uniref:LuxE/PaaK family acyltransferase n=1 Tax=Clostridium sp. SM-530-WT-3G TaxID=2725303 RepID=UPI00145CF8D7|nr:acyl-protein synthetase [Clostridium sp. SM-530-WT-3G]NME82779.1 acyl-protein synthetase [Clostridium sp. SM-530-WT-3G]
MIDYSQVFKRDPYCLNREEKHEFLNEYLRHLTKHHYNSCDEYRRIIDSKGIEVNNISNYYDIPFLPVRMFKEFNLVSVEAENVLKTMMSSGTTGNKVSKIYLNKKTALSQTKALGKIISSFIGSKRLPMIILDTSEVVKNRAMFSARGAGILGFQMFSYDRVYALNDDMSLNIDSLVTFLEKHKNESILVFGFTFMIWQHFYTELKNSGKKIDLSNGILIHGGGWKNMMDKAVTAEKFKQGLNSICGIKKIYDYYGMVEQTGSIYMECECGHFHSSIYSDIIVRNPFDFSVSSIGEKGIIEVVSILPESYPGHILLTEDEGILLGEDDCACGRLGKYFKITGRIKNSEIRGCSDTYADKFK